MTAAAAAVIALSISGPGLGAQTLEQKASQQRLDALNQEIQQRLFGGPGNPPKWLKRHADGRPGHPHDDPELKRLLAARDAEEAKVPKPDVPPGKMMWQGKITDPAALVPKNPPLSLINPSPPR
jgi:hypothetical protein